MSPARWRTIQGLFHEVVDRSRNEQLSSLKAVCSGDRELENEVMALLEADAQSEPVVTGSFSYAVSQLFDDDPNTYLGQTFGPYLLKESLGQGGMGKVFLAERQDYGGSVAVKVLHDALSPERRRRFAAEQRMLAQLNHPSIARLYDAGSLPDGTPFFAMEYVDGLSLIEYCQQHRLSIRKRLQLFRTVCGAVQFAHQHGIIHRDLKPSNILVGEDGTVKLLDFGIAESIAAMREQNGTRHTNYLTMAYAAPEQIRCELATVQADVYALGVILHQVLASELPFDFSDKRAEQIRRLVLNESPRKPSQAAASNPKDADWPDLDALCAKTMHKDPAQRYGSVEAFLRDIDHYLAGEALDARQPSSVQYRLGKFVRRHARQIAALATVVLILIALAAFYTVRLAKARNFAQAEAARALAVQQFMLGLFAGGDEDVGPSADVRVVTLIDRGEKKIPNLEGQPAVQAELYQTLGNLDQVLGRYDRARALLMQALQLRKLIYGADQPQVAETMLLLGQLSRDQARMEEAEKWLRKALAIDRRALPPNALDLVKTKSMLGEILISRGSDQEAIPLLEASISILNATAGPIDVIGDNITELAIAHYDLGDYSISKSLNLRALAIDKQRYGENHPYVASDYMNLLKVDAIEGRYEEGEQYARKALRIDEKWLGNQHPEVASAMTALAQMLTSQKRYPEAESLLRAALKIEETRGPEPHNRVANVLMGLGKIELERGQLDAAEIQYSHAMEIYRAVYGVRHSSIGLALAGLGNVYAARKQDAKAEQLFRQALDMFKATVHNDNQDVAITDVSLGKLMLSEHRYPEAEAWLLAGNAIFDKKDQRPNDRMLDVKSALTDLYQRMNLPDKAQFYRSGEATHR